MKNVKSCEWVREHGKHIHILDAGIVKPGEQGMYSPAAILPMAKRFDISHALSDPLSKLPNMMCSPQQFQAYIRQLGINQDDTIVLYDDKGLFSAARGWWMLKNMGFEHVFIMDGGLPMWQSLDLPVCKHYAVTTRLGNFTASPRHSQYDFIDREVVLNSINDPDSLLLDARAYKRFSGEEKEPRQNMRSGHIPQSKSVHYASLLTENCLLKEVSELGHILEHLGCKGKKLQFSCGSGVTACILALVADECGYYDLSVYDGSWSEWGRQEFADCLPIA